MEGVSAHLYRGVDRAMTVSDVPVPGRILWQAHHSLESTLRRWCLRGLRGARQEPPSHGDVVLRSGGRHSVFSQSQKNKFQIDY